MPKEHVNDVLLFWFVCILKQYKLYILHDSDITNAPYQSVVEPYKNVASYWQLVLTLAPRATWGWCTDTETCRSDICYIRMWTVLYI
jgi:hypothetical protein